MIGTKAIAILLRSNIIFCVRHHLLKKLLACSKVVSKVKEVQVLVIVVVSHSNCGKEVYTDSAPKIVCASQLKREQEAGLPVYMYNKNKTDRFVKG